MAAVRFMTFYSGETALNRPFKRLLALAGGATLGLFGAVALASPAQAHHTDIVGVAVCQANGEFKVDWSVKNGNWDNRTAKVLEITADPSSAINGIAVGAEIAPSGTANGTQTIAGTTTTATLTVKAQWFNSNGTATDIVYTSSGSATGFQNGCAEEPQPTATFVAKCDGTVNVHLVNPGKGELKFTVKGTGFSKEVTVPTGGEADEIVPAGAGEITVTADGVEVAKYAGWVRPAECPKPSVLPESTCDKFTLKLTNPQGGQSTEATVTYGTQVKKLTIAPGKTETVELTPSSETDAVVEFSGWGRQVIKYEKPANCPGLPQTGDKIGGYLASGAGLIGLGAVVFFLARRRMVQLRRMAS